MATPWAASAASSQGGLVEGGAGQEGTGGGRVLAGGQCLQEGRPVVVRVVQQGQGLKFVGGQGAGEMPEQVRAGHGDQFLREQGHCFELGWKRGPGEADGHVDLIVFEVRQGLGGQGAQFQAGQCRLQIGQAVHQQAGGYGGGDADGDGVRPGLQFCCCAGQYAKGTRDIVQVGGAGRGEGQSTWQAPKEGNAQPFLQPPYLLGHGALGDVQFVGGCAEGPFAAGHFEGAQGVEGWQAVERGACHGQGCEAVVFLQSTRRRSRATAGAPADTMSASVIARSGFLSCLFCLPMLPCLPWG